jgi:YVTN family beta-propeller protein
VRYVRLLATISLLVVLVFILSGKPATFTAVGNAPTIQVKRSSSAIAITADGTRLIAINPDSNSVSLVDTAALKLLAEIPVGVDPRTVVVDDAGLTAYVANRGSGTVSVIDLQNQRVTAEIAVGTQPYGLLVSPDGRFLYLAEQGSGYLRFIDTSTLQTTRRLFIGDRPSGLALANDGQTLYVTHLLDNKITPVDTRWPYLSFLPAIIDQQSGTSSAPITQPSTSAIQASISLFPDSNLVQSMVLAPDGQTAYIPHTISNSGNRILTFESTVIPLVSLVDLESGLHLTGQQFDLGTLDPPGVGLPFDAAVTPDGAELWVLNAASNDISVIDLASRQLLAHIEVGDNPRGIVLSPDGQKAYINNTLSGTVSVVDTTSYIVTQSIVTTQIPLPPLLLEGKKLFHSSDDPRMSNAQWIACSSCHFDGGHDGRTWFFPFAGPRNTTSLHGMNETYPLRWSGEWDESADSEFAIRRENFGLGLIDGDMHCDLLPADCVKPSPNQGRSAELDALAAFMDGLAMPLSPGHRRGEPLSSAEKRGRILFEDPELDCLACHPPPLYSDLLPHDVGTTTGDERIGPAYDTPTLRGLYGSAPYFHDGSAATLNEALTRSSSGDEHDLSGRLSEPEMNDLIQYLLALPYR